MRWILIGCCAGVVVFLVYQNVKIYQKRQELSKKVQESKSQVQALQQEKKNIQTGIQNSQNIEYQEKILREEGLYKKPGEQVITVLRSSNGQNQPNGLVETTGKPAWQTWLESVYRSIVGK